MSWVDYRDANEEEYTRRSRDGSVTWGAITRVSDDPADSWAPSVAISGDVTHHFWFDRRHAAHSDVEVEKVLDEAAALVGDLVDVVWFDGRDGSGPDERETEIYYLGSTDGGKTWSTDRRLTTASGTSKHASIAATAHAVHVVWFDERDGRSAIDYKRMSR